MGHREPDLRKCIEDLKGKTLSLRNSLPGWLLDQRAGNLTKDGCVRGVGRVAPVSLL